MKDYNTKFWLTVLAYFVPLSLWGLSLDWFPLSNERSIFLNIDFFVCIFIFLGLRSGFYDKKISLFSGNSFIFLFTVAWWLVFAMPMVMFAFGVGDSGPSNLETTVWLTIFGLLLGFGATITDTIYLIRKKDMAWKALVHSLTIILISLIFAVREFVYPAPHAPFIPAAILLPIAALPYLFLTAKEKYTARLSNRFILIIMAVATLFAWGYNALALHKETNELFKPIFWPVYAIKEYTSPFEYLEARKNFTKPYQTDTVKIMDRQYRFPEGMILEMLPDSERIPEHAYKLHLFLPMNQVFPGLNHSNEKVSISIDDNKYRYIDPENEGKIFCYEEYWPIDSLDLTYNGAALHYEHRHDLNIGLSCAEMVQHITAFIEVHEVKK